MGVVAIEMPRYETFGFVFEDGKGSVKLLGEDSAHYLVRECHLGEGELAVGTLVDSIGESVGASNNKDKTLGARRHTLLDEVRKLKGA